MAIATFEKNPDNTSYDGEDQDEKILYVQRASLLTTLPWIFASFVFLILPFAADPFLRSFQYNGEKVVSYSFLAILTLFWYLFTFGFFFHNFASWYFNVYIITTKKIIDMDFYGLTYKNISETTLDNIEDVTSQVKGTLGTIFNYGDVYVQTAGEKREFDFVAIDDPGRTRDIISDLAATAKRYGNN